MQLDRISDAVHVLRASRSSGAEPDESSGEINQDQKESDTQGEADGVVCGHVVYPEAMWIGHIIFLRGRCQPSIGAQCGRGSVTIARVHMTSSLSLWPIRL